MNNQIKVEPVISGGGYAYCPICGYYDLLPTQHNYCPKCKVEIDWDWYEKMKIKKYWT